MAGPDRGGRGDEIRARLDTFRETETLAGAGIDELAAGLKRACARVNTARPEASGTDRLNPQHWGYGLYVYFRNQIIVRCTILPITDMESCPSLLQVEVSTVNLRPITTLTLERIAPANAEWRSDERRIDPEAFFLDLLESYASTGSQD